MRVLPLLLLSCSMCTSCNVEQLDASGECLPLEGSPGGRGLVVVDSDYLSTNVALVDWTGDGKSRSVLSSGSTTAGLSAALSGDVVTASSAQLASGEVALLDRKTGVISWVETGRCGVRGQMSVGARTNPYDYLEIAQDRAYVARFRLDPDTSKAPVDRGGDVLVIDPRARTARSSIDLTPFVSGSAIPLTPNPARLMRYPTKGSGDRVLVLLQAFSATGFDEAGDAVVVTIDPATDTATSSLTVAGVKNCQGAAALPEGRVALACTGLLGLDGIASEEGTSALVVLEASEGGRLKELFRIPSSSIDGRPLLPFISWVSGEKVVVGSYGNLVQPGSDRWSLVDLGTGEVKPVASSSEAFALGALLCSQSASPVVCLGADASKSSPGLRRFLLDDGSLKETPRPPLQDPYGLPPRTLGPLLFICFPGDTPTAASELLRALRQARLR